MGSLKFGFLSNVQDQVLVRWLRRDFPAISELPISRNQLEKVLYAVFGFSLFDSIIRRADYIFSTRDEDFDSLCLAFNLDKNGKTKFDIANELAGKKWSEAALLPSLFHTVLGVEYVFLPQSDASGSMATTLIVPAQSVPPMYDYQSQLASDVQAFLASTEMAAVMQLPTGAGKTRVALEALIAQIATENVEKKSFIWLAHTQELCEQAFETFSRIWVAKGMCPIKAYKLWGNRKARIDESQPSAVFSTFGKFSNMYEKGEVATLVGSSLALIVDEAHRAPSKVFGKLLNELKRHVKLLGLTATPGRNVELDYENFELKKLFNSRLLVSTLLGENPISDLQERGILSKPNLRFIKGSSGKYQIDSSGEVSSSTLESLASDCERNEIIVKQVQGLSSQGKKVLIFSCSVAHSKELTMRLALEGVLASFVDSNMSNSRRMAIIKAYKSGATNVLVNYGVLSTGFDVPDISAVVIARPTSSIVLYSQMIGRGMRGKMAGGSDDFVVFDIRDNSESFGDANEVYKHFDSLWAS